MRKILIAVLAATVLALGAHGASAGHYKVLHDFCAKKCTDGAGLRLSGSRFTTFDPLMSFGDAATPGTGPVGGLMLDSSGAFFGNTISGGAASNAATLFRYTP